MGLKVPFLIVLNTRGIPTTRTEDVFTGVCGGDPNVRTGNDKLFGKARRGGTVFPPDLEAVPSESELLQAGVLPMGAKGLGGMAKSCS